MKIDVATTATVRPDLLDKVYASFTKSFLTPRDRFRLVLNVDPIGDDKYTVQDVIDVGKTYFDECVINTPKEPNLSKAVKWCFENVENEYVFYLEDDWILHADVKLEKMISILERNSHLHSLGLNKMEKEAFLGQLKKGQWKNVEAIERHYAYIQRISLNPVLIKRDFVNRAAKLIRTNYKPESQLRQPNSAMKKVIGKGKFASYISEEAGYAPILIDVGASWAVKSKWKKKKKNGFLFWTEK